MGWWGGWDGMGVCPTPARHVTRPTLCVSGLCHRLPRAGLGATQTTTDPVRDRRVKFPYPHSLGTLVGVTSGASGPHSRTHTCTMSFHGPDRGAWRAPRKAVSGVSALTRKQWQSLQVPHRAAAAEAHRRRCTVRDMMHEVRAEPLDHWTRSAGIETGEVCQRTSRSPRLRVCSTWYGSGTAAPSGSHLPQGRHPPKRFLVVEAPCSGLSDAVGGGGGGTVCRPPSSMILPPLTLRPFKLEEHCLTQFRKSRRHTTPKGQWLTPGRKSVSATPKGQ